MASPKNQASILSGEQPSRANLGDDFSACVFLSYFVNEERCCGGFNIYVSPHTRLMTVPGVVAAATLEVARERGAAYSVHAFSCA